MAPSLPQWHEARGSVPPGWSEGLGWIALRHEHPCIPSRGASVSGRAAGLGNQAGLGERPGDHRVRVPHLACVKLVTTPYRSGHEGQEVEDVVHEDGIDSDANRAGYGIADVGDLAVPPASDFVTKHTKVSSPSR